MEKRGQSALEYLMTYGWALIVIAIVIGVLIYVTGTSAGGVICQSKSNSWVVVRSEVGTGSAAVLLRNATSEEATINSVTPLGDWAGGTGTGTGTIAKNETATVGSSDRPSTAGSFDDGALQINYTAGGLTADFNVVCAGSI